MGKRIFPDPAQQHLLDTVRLELVGPADVSRWNELITAHHYLHNATLVGEVLRYAAVAADGVWCALVGYSSASLHLKARDAHLGWTAAQRECRLHFVTQNSRFLLLPGVACPNLASRLLKLAAQRLREDFPRVHGHPVLLVETFVDPTRYRGACYQAANWEPLGRTAGYARAGRDYYEKHDRPKEIWVQPLAPDAAATLAAATLPAYLAALERTPPPRNRLALPALLSLLELFALVPDPRRAAGTRHRLATVLACAAVGVLAGGRTLADLAATAAELSQPHLRALRCWLHPRTGRRVAPSESTFQRTLGQIDAALLDQLLGQWQLARTPGPAYVAVDGKALKGTPGLHLFSAFCGENESVLAQAAIPDKTNEGRAEGVTY